MAELAEFASGKQEWAVKQELPFLTTGLVLLFAFFV